MFGAISDALKEIHNHFNFDLDRRLTVAPSSNRTAPPSWPSGVNWRPEISALSRFGDRFALV